MHLPLFISKRYLISKKRQGIINIISAVSAVGVMIGTMALVVILSVFNGIDKLVSGMAGTFDSDVKIIPAEGKLFAPDSLMEKSLQDIGGLVLLTKVTEESCLVKYEDSQRPVVVKGISADYAKVKGIDSMLYAGKFSLTADNTDGVVPGYNVAKDLGIGLNFTAPMEFYFPKRKKNSYINALNSFNREYAYPSGIFSIQQELDAKYVFTSLDFANRLFETGGRISSYEMMFSEDTENAKEKVAEITGAGYTVLDRYEQNATLYKMMNSEKLAIFVILIFILFIASFNIVGSITMLIIDKKEDMAIMSCMGMSKNDIEKIFRYEGWMITVVGAVAGLVLGVLLCLLQQEFGLLTLGGGFVVYAYPVEMVFTDIAAVMAAVLLIGYAASRFPVRLLVKRLL